MSFTAYSVTTTTHLQHLLPCAPQVLASNNEMVLFPVNEPTFGTKRKSQIQVRRLQAMLQVCLLALRSACTAVWFCTCDCTCQHVEHSMEKAWRSLSSLMHTMHATITQTYLEQNEGPGLQHLALKTNDIIATMREMRARSEAGGFEFMPRLGDAYYRALPARIVSRLYH